MKKGFIFHSFLDLSDLNILLLPGHLLEFFKSFEKVLHSAVGRPSTHV